MHPRPRNAKVGSLHGCDDWRAVLCSLATRLKVADAAVGDELRQEIHQQTHVQAATKAMVHAERVHAIRAVALWMGALVQLQLKSQSFRFLQAHNLALATRGHPPRIRNRELAEWPRAGPRSSCP